MKKQTGFILGLVLALIVVIFAIMNVETIAINFGFTKVELPLILILLISLVLGAVIAALLSTGTTVSLKRQTKKLQKDLDAAVQSQQEQVDLAVAKVKADTQSQIESQSKTISDLQEKLTLLQNDQTPK
ncbi:LapA family protein [Lapidilactobacillus bayanensis]|uniref:LapA family protein n=1 Tax=Lapidilactobacillus bayanensis TaxID=2485998 RepID=UPI000F7974D6|nr:lipopolysaccharide assembly protein LapA domain-containing protein [Lapidilactobacillus bayanensis]